MTGRQEALLAEIRAGRVFYVYGSDVQVARALERRGLVTLTDNGELEPGRNRDGERWSVVAVVV